MGCRYQADIHGAFIWAALYSMPREFMQRAEDGHQSIGARILTFVAWEEMAALSRVAMELRAGLKTAGVSGIADLVYAGLVRHAGSVGRTAAQNAELYDPPSHITRTSATASKPTLNQH